MLDARRKFVSENLAELMAVIVNVAPFRKGNAVSARDFLRGSPKRGSDTMQVPFSRLLDAWCPPA